METLKPFSNLDVNFPTLPATERFNALLKTYDPPLQQLDSHLNGIFFQLLVDDYLHSVYTGKVIVEEWKTAELLRQLANTKDLVSAVGKNHFTFGPKHARKDYTIPDDLIFEETAANTFRLTHIIEASLYEAGNRISTPSTVNAFVKFINTGQGRNIFSQVLQLHLNNDRAYLDGIKPSGKFYVRVSTPTGARNIKDNINRFTPKNPAHVKSVPFDRLDFDKMANNALSQLPIPTALPV